MDCSKIMDMVYRYSGRENEGEDSLPLLSQIQIWLHTFFCTSCTEKTRRLEITRSIMRQDFFPPPPGLEESIMKRLSLEEEFTETAHYAFSGGLSTRSWVITGLIIFISLTTAFFGLDFQNIVRETGTSFLLPVSITVGIVLTTYGAIFIGSHLKEFTERFGL